jgi:TPR repeat protein
VKVWNADSGAPIAVLPGHLKRVGCATFDPSGTKIASVSLDGTVRIWPWSVELSDDQSVLAAIRSLRTLTTDERTKLFLDEGPTSPRSIHKLDACDQFAAHPLDPTKRRPGSGIGFENLDAKAAIVACKDAVSRKQTEPRFRYEPARALEKDKQFAEAVTNYQSSVADDYPAALHNLAAMYDEGTGVDKDVPKAISLWEHAFNLGFTASGHSLALHYWTGIGVSVDRQQARAIWSRAARMGDPDAHERLGWIAEVGRDGGERDLDEALFHYALATRLFEAKGGEGNASRTRIRRGTLARSMGAADVLKTWRRVTETSVAR